MSKYESKGFQTYYCRICGREVYTGEAVEWVKHKGSTYYVHTDCLKKEGFRHD